MKYLKISISALALVLMAFSVNAQSCKSSCCSSKKANKTEVTSETTEAPDRGSMIVKKKKNQTATFKVYGNCGMCKSRIEGALDGVKGIRSASWDTGTKMMTVNFNEKKVSLDHIHAKIAAVGHDTEKVRAKDSVYDELHGCCKYDREKS